MTAKETTFKRDTMENFEAQVKKATLPLMVLTVRKNGICMLTRSHRKH